MHTTKYITKFWAFLNILVRKYHIHYIFTTILTYLHVRYRFHIAVIMVVASFSDSNEVMKNKVDNHIHMLCLTGMCQAGARKRTQKQRGKRFRQALFQDQLPPRQKGATNQTDYKYFLNLWQANKNKRKEQEKSLSQ